ncbi:MAG: peroxiredoxin-like family protein [Nitrososphaerales archaeon]
MTTLNEQLTEQAASSSGDPELRAIRERAIEEIRHSAEAPGLAVGARIPAFTLPDAEGKLVSSEKVLADGPLVISFYRGDWCPYCNLELRALEVAARDIAALGASIVAISGQRPDAAAGLTDKHGISFPVLSDVDQVVISAFGLRYEIPAELRKSYEERGTDMSSRNADGSWTLPISATYVVDATGVIVVAHNDPDYRVRLEPSAIVETLSALQK